MGEHKAKLGGTWAVRLVELCWWQLQHRAVTSLVSPVCGTAVADVALGRFPLCAQGFVCGTRALPGAAQLGGGAW